MQKLGGAVIHMLEINSNIKSDYHPLIPFSELVCSFLSNLSIELLKDAEAKNYSDVITFAFWCRKGSIMRLKGEFSDKQYRLGVGLVFHIAPSNVPIIFAYSYAVSLLAGNANIVRLPSKKFPQVDIVCRIINKIFENSSYREIGEMTQFIRYEHNDEITSYFSKQCNVRIIWGGDNTIKTVRKIPIPPRSTDIVFADRYSFCIINSSKIIDISDYEIGKLADNFYNDTYLMDQNACSSPQLIVWIDDTSCVKVAKERFWNSVYAKVQEKYKLSPVNAIDKYTQLCDNAIDLDCLDSQVRYKNYIYRLVLKKIPENITDLRGRYGYFYEYDTNDINDIAEIVTNKYQTLTYYGFDKEKLINFVINNRLKGIDRIVPIGSALDFSVIWDGYDLIRSLSRVIDVK